MICIALVIFLLIISVLVILFIKRQNNLFEVITRLQKVHEEERKEWFERFEAQEIMLREYIINTRSGIDEKEK